MAATIEIPGMDIDNHTGTEPSMSARPARGLKLLTWFLVCVCCTATVVLAADPVEDTAAVAAIEEQVLLGEATVSEIVKNGIPFNSAAAFSIKLGRIYCFTDFVAVDAKTVIYHNWFHRDAKRASVKLALRPPRWATFSSVTLRDSDKGPWQVEITTENGKVLQILRFSVID